MMMLSVKDVGIILMDQDKDSIQNFRGKKLGFFRNTREMLAQCLIFFLHIGFCKFAKLCKTHEFVCRKSIFGN